MRKETKLLLFTIICFSTAILLIIYRYEGLLNALPVFDHVSGGAKANKKYTAVEINQLIKNSKEYIGDSVTIFENGEIQSSNMKFQGTINAIIGSKDNMNQVNSNTALNRLPVQYNIYVLAAIYYRMQYPAEFKDGKLPNRDQ